MNEIFKGMDNAAEQINENFEGIADYVVEQGENYTKWASGRLECWTLINYTEDVPLDWIPTGGYSRSDTFEWVFPVEFTGTPIVTHSTLDFTGSDFVGVRVMDGTKARYRYMSFLNKSQSSFFAFGIRAEGKWK